MSRWCQGRKRFHSGDPNKVARRRKCTTGTGPEMALLPILNVDRLSDRTETDMPRTEWLTIGARTACPALDEKHVSVSRRLDLAKIRLGVSQTRMFMRTICSAVYGVLADKVTWHLVHRVMVLTYCPFSRTYTVSRPIGHPLEFSHHFPGIAHRGHLR